MSIKMLGMLDSCKMMQLSDWLDDLCVRFIINLPQEELMSVERICFQVEEAQWFYEDFVRPQDPELPSLNLKEFCLRVFQHCPLLAEYSPYHHAAAFSEFLAYKERVPVRGAILLNHDMNQVLLVKGWKKSASWSFPRGKINKAEPDLDCAVREVYEETGYDLQSAGLVGTAEDTKYIEMTIREQHMRLYIFAGIPTETQFEPRTRKEISAIQWYNMSDLPTLKKQKQQGEDPGANARRFYMVAPFMNPLKKWISQQKKIRKPTEVSQLPSILTTESSISLVAQDHSPTSIHGTTITVKIEGTPVASSESRSMSDLPEVSKPTMSLEDTSAQLKSLLGVPSNNTFGTPIEVISDSDYLLALLRPKGVQNLPHTTLDPNFTSKLTSRSPQPSTTVISNTIGHPLIEHQTFTHHQIDDSQGNRQPSPPHQQTGDPQFNHQLFSLHQQGQLIHQSFPPYHQLGSPRLGHQNLPPHVEAGDPKLDHETIPPYRRADDPLHNRENLAPHQQIGNHQLGHHNLPPYKRTGDPQFASNSQIPKKDAVSIPPADKLPLPTLTTHSTTLLSLFKEIKLTKTQLPIHPASIEHLDGNFNSSPEEVKNVGGLAKTPLPFPSPIQITEPIASIKSRSEHQDKLLTLFRPSMAKTKDSYEESSKHQPQNLGLLSTLAELSALPSPAHSRVPSKVDVPSSNAGSDARMNPPPIKQEQPTATHIFKDPSVFATVNGPLNAPQFELLAEASKSGKGKSPNDKHPTAAGRSNFKILPRPPPSSMPRVADTNNISSIFAKSKTIDEKVLQPQVPHRPDQTSAMSRETVSSSMKPPPPPARFTKFDDKINQTQDHKKTLLSLFNKTLPATSPGSFNPTTVISPLSERPHQGSSPIITPLTSRSRAGSVISALGEGKLRISNARQTPVTTSLDKDFLLGYLNGVASGERR